MQPLAVKLQIAEQDKHQFDGNTLLYHNGKVYSAADDGKIKCWSKNLNLICEVKAHPCSVYSLAALNDKIYSCSNEGTIKSWTEDLQPISTLITTDCEFWKLAVGGNDTLYVGTDLGTVYSYVNDKLVGRYELLEPIKDMAVDPRDKFRLFTSKDNDIIITELGHESNKTFITRKMITGRAPLVLEHDKLVFTDHTAKGICLHKNEDDYKYTHIASVPDAHEMIINAILGVKVGGEDYVLTGGWDKEIKRWHITDSEMKLQDSCKVNLVVNAMIADEAGAIYATGGDGLVIKLE